MNEEDFAEGRRASTDLRLLMIRNPGGRADSACLESIAALCLAASRIEDDECRRHMRGIHAQASDLFSASGHIKWRTAGMEGQHVLRLQILGLLDLYNVRLETVEWTYRRTTERPRENPRLAGTGSGGE